MSKFHHRVIGFLMMFGIAFMAENDQHTQPKPTWWKWRESWLGE